MRDVAGWSAGNEILDLSPELPSARASMIRVSLSSTGQKPVQLIRMLVPGVASATMSCSLYSMAVEGYSQKMTKTIANPPC
jgi:hypothetical protein